MGGSCIWKAAHTNGTHTIACGRWFEGVLHALVGLPAGHVREDSLSSIGILSLGDTKIFKRKWREVWGKTAPRCKAVKAQHWRDLIRDKMQYIPSTLWPSQKTRKMSCDEGEVERLRTVLYYEIMHDRSRSSEGEHNDEGD